MAMAMARIILGLAAIIIELQIMAVHLCQQRPHLRHVAQQSGRQVRDQLLTAHSFTLRMMAWQTGSNPGLCDIAELALLNPVHSTE